MPTFLIRSVLLAALVVVAGRVAEGQRFDVASLKPTPPSSTALGGRVRIQPGGRVVATASTLNELVQWAWQVQPFQLTGGPDWAAITRFEVTAQGGSPSAGRQELAPMVRRLLEERFQLRTRVETREMPIFRLVRATRDGRLGPRLQPSAVDCVAVLNDRAAIDAPPPDPEQATCQPRQRLSATTTTATMAAFRTGASMAHVASMLVPFARRTVVDATGLTGRYNFDLTFSPDRVMVFVDGGPPRDVQPADGTTLATALEEQLGLKLEPARGPVDVLIIEAAESPAPD